MASLMETATFKQWLCLSIVLFHSNSKKIRRLADGDHAAARNIVTCPREGREELRSAYLSVCLYTLAYLKNRGLTLPKLPVNVTCRPGSILLLQ